MDITPLIKDGQNIIQGYGSGKIKVSGKSYDSAVYVFPDRIVDWTLDKPANDAGYEDFAQLFDDADDIDVVLFGCGEKIMFMPPKTKQSLKDKGLQIEVMDTGAACRTYNVLMAEGRRVVAALIPV